jgi:DNA-binding MarR family transcriptional regulator
MKGNEIPGIYRDKVDRYRVKGKLTPSGQRRLRRLEAEYGAMLNQLLNNPSDENLSRRVRIIEADIIRLTDEQTLDY